MKQEAYYNREMLPQLVEWLEKENYQWLIDFVNDHKELDFQTGSNKTKGKPSNSWFSLYKGTSRILRLKCGVREKLVIDADKAYMDLDKDFYDTKHWEKHDVETLKLRLRELMNKIDKEKEKFGSYYINKKGEKKEGYYQNLISRRYSLDCEPNDNLLIFDKEFVIGYESTPTKKRWGEKPKEWAEKKILQIKEQLGKNCAKNIKVPGDECDFVGINKNGDLVLLELKCNDPTKTYLAPLQVGMYGALVTQLLKKYKNEIGVAIFKQIKQKQELKILKPAWEELPKELSGNVKMAVVVGGKISSEVKRRFEVVKGVIGKDVAFYTCDEKGNLIEVEIFKEMERERQLTLLSADAKKCDGEKLFYGDCGGDIWTAKAPYILQDGDKNLYKDIQEPAKKYFDENKIKWWTLGVDSGKKPTGHILSSQIACLNHLFMIKNDHDAVLALLNGVRNEYDDVSPIEYDNASDKGFIGFEVVSKHEYLRENSYERKRGEFCTSIDAFILAHHKPTDKNHLIVIEWKYTETYKDKDLSIEDRYEKAVGTNGKGHERMSRYNDLIFLSEYLKVPKDNKFQGSVYYQEPFYQLMRQTLWAEEVIKHRPSNPRARKKEPIEADDYLHLHVVPKSNNDLLCKGFPGVGDTLKETWQNMLTDKGKERYILIDPQDLLAPIANEKKFSKYADLITYLRTRYWD